ncbi:MAG: hypothetical protein FWG82_03190 [Oscillospiraceae bacterium]|nr:hypothetical protein [Oscillospiraceae bacterium]
MKKSIKNGILISIGIIAMLLTTTGGYYTYRHFVPPQKTITKSASYAIDIGDLRQNIATVSYVFVGYVEETYDMNTTRLYRKYPESARYEHIIAATEIKVRVVKNIKGTLPIEEAISIYNDMGLTSSLSRRVTTDSIMADKSKYYVFSAVAVEDGELWVCEAYTTVPLEEEITSKNLNDSKVYKIYLKAYEEQGLPLERIQMFEDTPSYMSKYDKRFNNTGQLLPKEKFAILPENSSAIRINEKKNDMSNEDAIVAFPEDYVANARNDVIN